MAFFLSFFYVPIQKVFIQDVGGSKSLFQPVVAGWQYFTADFKMQKWTSDFNATRRRWLDSYGAYTYHFLLLFTGSEKHCDSSYLPDDVVLNEDRRKRKYQIHNGDAIFRGVYSFPVEPIPRRNCFDEESVQFLQEGVRCNN